MSINERFEKVTKKIIIQIIFGDCFIGFLIRLIKNLMSLFVDTPEFGFCKETFDYSVRTISHSGTALDFTITPHLIKHNIKSITSKADKDSH